MIIIVCYLCVLVFHPIVRFKYDSVLILSGIAVAKVFALHNLHWRHLPLSINFLWMTDNRTCNANKVSIICVM